MSIEFVLRLIGMVVLSIGGWQLGVYLAGRPGQSPEDHIRYVLILSLSGAALGLLLTPWFTTKPFAWIRKRIRQLPAQQLLAIIVGLVVGLDGVDDLLGVAAFPENGAAGHRVLGRIGIGLVIEIMQETGQTQLVLVLAEPAGVGPHDLFHRPRMPSQRLALGVFAQQGPGLFP